MAYEQVLQETPYEHKSPMKQSAFLPYRSGNDRAIILGQTLSDRLYLRWICRKELVDETSWMHPYEEVYG